MKIQVRSEDPTGLVLRVDPPAFVLKDERLQDNSKGTIPQ